MGRFPFANINEKFLEAISNEIIPLVESKQNQGRRNACIL